MFGGSRLWSITGQVFRDFLLPLKKILETIVCTSCFFTAQEVHLRKEVNAFPDGFEIPEALKKSHLGRNALGTASLNE